MVPTREVSAAPPQEPPRRPPRSGPQPLTPTQSSAAPRARGTHWQLRVPAATHRAEDPAGDTSRERHRAGQGVAGTASPPPCSVRSRPAKVPGALLGGWPSFVLDLSQPSR